ncbi:hypothetical protein IJI69_02795 [Candidatus Saccharibacteria bacterium]|nr:hypothetical protein [Candidatus Saccharibacteria bacterium]
MMDNMGDFQKVVYARLQTMPKDFIIATGEFGEVTRDQALEHVKNNDEVGKFIIQINRDYFEMIKSGELNEYLS